MPDELPPEKELGKPANSGVPRGSYTQRLQAMRAGQAPVPVSKPRLFERGKKPKAVAAPRDEDPASPKRTRAPSDHPRPHKGAGLCPPCRCGCSMTKHATPWIVADLKAGPCKTHRACTAYAATPAAPPVVPAKPAGLDRALMAKVAEERLPPKPAPKPVTPKLAPAKPILAKTTSDPVASTTAALQARVEAGETVAAKDASKAFRTAVPAEALPADALPLPPGRKALVTSQKQEHMAPERMKTILTEVTAFADEMHKGGSSHLAGIASDLQTTAHRLRDLLADLLISRLAKA